MSALTTSNKRPVRSYILRQGRLTKHQERGIKNFSSKYSIPFQKSFLNFDQVFPKRNKVILEIGFGMGDSTFEIAQVMNDFNFLAVEVHSPGVGSLLNKINLSQIENLKIIQHDGIEVLNEMIPRRSLDGVHIFFPDPWPKKKHHKRRLLKKSFLELIEPKLTLSGYIHIATDWEPYAIEIIDLVKQSKFYKMSNRNFNKKPQARPFTKYEKRGLRLGHQVWDMIITLS
ncbi:MAG: tRNA (guanosine(46)-N7)-methyltransferase TrmB [Nitrosomonadales bacterium]|nr:tRNA (guanosine(46)-N7)-methyltransferase TrmB [Nitrosomonadales bacterium]